MSDGRVLGRTVAAHCLALRSRRAARIVTNIYEEALRPLGLSTARHALLAAISGWPGVRASQLSASMDLDKSTLSRNLRRMAEHGLVRIEEAPGHGQRLFLLPAGTELLKRAHPAWQAAQVQAEQALGAVAEALLARFPDPTDPR